MRVEVSPFSPPQSSSNPNMPGTERVPSLKAFSMEDRDPLPQRIHAGTVIASTLTTLLSYSKTCQAKTLVRDFAL